MNKRRMGANRFLSFSCCVGWWGEYFEKL